MMTTPAAQAAWLKLSRDRAAVPGTPPQFGSVAKDQIGSSSEHRTMPLSTRSIVPVLYPCAVTRSEIEDPQALNYAFRWLQERRMPGQKILLWTRRKADLGRDRGATKIARSPHVVVGSQFSPYLSVWDEGPILGLWLDEDDFYCVPAGRPTALCAVPRHSSATPRQWIQSISPEFLNQDRWRARHV